MVAQSVAVYRFSISRVGLGLRALLIASSALPFFPFLLAVQGALSRTEPNSTLLSMLVATVFFIPAHEAMHGLLFWLFSRRVSFGFKPWSAFGPVFYAASAGSQFSRLQYQLVCLAPQFLTAVLVIAAAFRPPDAVLIALAYAATLNLGGGVVDIFVTGILTRFPRDAVVEDSQDGLEVFLLPSGN